MERDGYTAIVLGFDEKPVRLANKAELGIAKAAGGSKPQRFIREIRVSAEEVARTGLDAIEGGRPLVIPGLIMKIGMSLVRIMPLWVLRLASRLSAKRS